MSHRRDVLKNIRRLILSFREILGEKDVERFEKIFSDIVKDEIKIKREGKDIDSIRDGTDLVSYIGNFIELKKKGSRYWGLCPFHFEKTPSFSIHPEKQRYTCFGCGKNGSIFDFVMEREGKSFPDALKEFDGGPGAA